MAEETRHRYACSLDAPRLARHDLAEFLGPDVPADLVQSAILLVDELVANAVLHAAGPVEVRARLDAARLHVEVADGSPQPPRLRDPDVGGRGLRIVDALAAAWGVTPAEGDGKAVWFEL
jgi:anti-sigma regulatory factor (Ser/Thr protein kinase)